MYIIRTYQEGSCYTDSVDFKCRALFSNFLPPAMLHLELRKWPRFFLDLVINISLCSVRDIVSSPRISLVILFCLDFLTRDRIIFCHSTVFEIIYTSKVVFKIILTSKQLQW